jgi:hypothetical protein
VAAEVGEEEAEEGHRQVVQVVVAKWGQQVHSCVAQFV